MKKILMIVVGLIGLIVVVLGVKQMIQGVNEMSGTDTTPAPKLGETFTSAEQNYSFRIPEGWQSKPGSQTGMPMISAPEESGQVGNMIVTAETFAGSLNDYVEANKVAVQEAAPNSKILSDTIFVTEGKETAHKVKLQNKVDKVDLIQTMYFFEGANQLKVIVTCTASAKYGAGFEALFDEGMTTFTFSDR